MSRKSWHETRGELQSARRFCKMISQLALFWLQYEIMHDIAGNMDPKVDPCVDFYSFACGNFKNRYVLSDDEYYLDPYSSTDHMIATELKSRYAVAAEPVTIFYRFPAFYSIIRRK